MQHTILQALIVDDEQATCHDLREMLAALPQIKINVAGMAHNTRDAEVLIARLQPDVVFLDIDMPNENAFRFLERIAPVPFEVVFVTAYDEYAVRAFRLNAVDYILKPVDTDQLQKAAEKVQEKIAYRRLVQEPAIPFSSLSQQITRKSTQEQIVLRSNNHIEVVPFKNILFTEAMRSYSRFVFRSNGEEKDLVMSYPITDYEELLPPGMFFRIHRSYLVNRLHVLQILREDQAYVLLSNKMKLPIGRRRYPDLLAFLKNNTIQNV